MALPEGLMERVTTRPAASMARLPHPRSGSPAVFALLLALAAASLVAASSEPPTLTPTADGVTIPYGDLDLSTIDGAMELERRLIEAAGAVCADLDSPAVSRDALERCRMDAVAGAILMLRRPPSAAAAVTS